MRVPRLIVFIALLGCGPFACARQKTYQTTKLVELEAGPRSFCFVVQVDDIAYVTVGRDQPGKMIVGDPIQIRIKNDDLYIKTKPKWAYDRDETKGRIKIRKRMVGDTKLPSCALAVSVH